MKRTEYMIAVSRLVQVVALSPSGSGAVTRLEKLDSGMFFQGCTSLLTPSSPSANATLQRQVHAIK